MGASINLPTPGGDANVWGTKLNTAITAVNNAIPTTPGAISAEPAGLSDATKAYVSDTIDAATEDKVTAADVAADIANPETPTSDAVSTLITAALAGFSLDSVPIQVVIDDDLTVARPDWSGPVYWITTVTDGVPTHAIAGDQVIEVDAEAVPDNRIFADDFERTDGTTLGTTPVGSLAWTLSSAGVTGVISDGTGGVTYVSARGYATVDASESEGTFETTLAANSAGLGQLVFRFTDSNNHLMLGRESTGSQKWALWKRVAATATLIATSTASIASGDQVSIVLNGTQVTVSVNGFQIIDEAVTEQADATLYGFGLGSAATIRWDDISLTPLA